NSERDYITPLLKSVPDHRLIDAVGCDLQLAAAYLKNSTMFLGNDSGLMHMAAAVQTPTLGLFGPNSLPKKFRPWGLHCSYIYKPRPDSHSSDDNDLMALISINEVLTAMNDLIRENRAYVHNRLLNEIDINEDNLVAD
ncbi:glycosyltransferase family 9 protein, partial [uncultured Legionella sp.]|uniref:glycosyltransferase family 9 protein n=1 Tax=uncultured Legionella sp. TaxID=210934 RepID=UPI0026314461